MRGVLLAAISRSYGYLGTHVVVRWRLGWWPVSVPTNLTAGGLLIMGNVLVLNVRSHPQPFLVTVLFRMHRLESSADCFTYLVALLAWSVYELNGLFDYFSNPFANRACWCAERPASSKPIDGQLFWGQNLLVCHHCRLAVCHHGCRGQVCFGRVAVVSYRAFGMDGTSNATKWTA